MHTTFLFLHLLHVACCEPRESAAQVLVRYVSECECECMCVLLQDTVHLTFDLIRSCSGRVNRSANTLLIHHNSLQVIHRSLAKVAYRN
jgi:hypothetical protein